VFELGCLALGRGTLDTYTIILTVAIDTRTLQIYNFC